MPWQLAQPLEMPLWLKAELAKVLPLATVAPVMLELAPMWQLSQPRLPMGMWLPTEPGVTMGRAVVVDAYRAALATLWHCWQLLLVDWMLLWIAPIVGEVPKGLWQSPHWAVDLYGMWLAGALGEPK